MVLSNVSFGIYAFLPQGWIFILFVIIIECLFLSKYLTNKWLNEKIYKTAFLTNIISGILGIVSTLMLNGGWLLVVWFPWVSSHEINLNTKGSLQKLIIFYMVAFLATLVIEILINVLMLKKQFNYSKIIKSSIIANVISYFIGSFILYSYSFS